MKQELIWELMKQAGELAYEEYKAKCLEEGLDPERTVWSVTGATYEKFAELIVRECVTICQYNADDDDDQFDLGRVHQAKEITHLIKKHFGVES